MKKIVLGFLFAAMLCGQAIAAESVVMIDLFFGPSGMMNYGTAGQPFPGGWTRDTGLQIWNATSGALETYNPGVNATGSNSALWGPEAEFERQKRLARPDINRIIVKVAIPNCGAALKASGVCDWNPLSSGKSWSTLWQTFVNAVGALPAGQLAVVETIGIVNGETDSVGLNYFGVIGTGGPNPSDANQFQKNDAMLVIATKQRLSIQNAHVILVRPSNNFPDIATPYLATVRTAIEALGASPGWAWVNVDDLTEAPPPYGGHLDAPSTVVEGFRMFQADQAILP